MIDALSTFLDEALKPRRKSALPKPVDPCFMPSDSYIDAPSSLAIKPCPIFVGLLPPQGQHPSSWTVVAASEATSVDHVLEAYELTLNKLPEFRTWFQAREQYASRSSHNAFEAMFFHALMTCVVRVDPELWPLIRIYTRLGIRHRADDSWIDGRCEYPRIFRQQARTTFKRHRANAMAHLAAWPSYRRQGLLGLVWGSFELVNDLDHVVKLRQALLENPLCRDVSFHRVCKKEEEAYDHVPTLVQYSVAAR